MDYGIHKPDRLIRRSFIKGGLAMASKPYKQLGCLDVDPKGECAFQVRAETEDEVMRLVAEHAKVCHKMTAIPPDMAAKVKGAIKTVPVNV
jgi:predicted small metal-binding protein